ncbi:helix-turn-helix domain-containing protein [Nocardia brasiliensis]|uniref:helix-turn-helix domain-containing protein n=1 Tax=Nocardia brasiliensis TaxID=37326 RepID=UPI002456A6E5|nr:helix-turn-helix transcriptional regulator [Nocardia brasiliensis]
MTLKAERGRYCARCGTRLSQYNGDNLCGSCESNYRVQPPELPMAFWKTDQMQDALATWHLGRVIYAYRTHPFHGRALPQETVAAWLGLTQAQLSRIEKGPAPEQLSKLVRWAEALQIPDDQLWFKLPKRNADSLDDVKRQTFLRGAAAVAVAPTAMLDVLGAIQPTPIPALVGSTEIEQIRTAARLFSSWDHTYGGGLVREAVAAQLRYAANLLNANCLPQNRHSLFSAVGFLSHTAAFMAFDAYAHDDARAMFKLALGCAEEAGDWHLRAKVLSSAARQAIWCGDPDGGLISIELALVRADRLSATERAMLNTARARALAKLGRVQEAARAVGRADEEFAHSSPANDPAWMSYYDAAQHAGDTGHALYDLAIQGKFASDARNRLTTAVEGHTDAFVRSRAISATKLASLIMAVGNPSEAATIGKHALIDASHLRSRRAADDLRELRRLAQHRADQPCVAELSERIHDVLATV